MAFKPFEIFRKRQKVMLAAMAILAMFLFVIGDAMNMRQGGGGSVLASTIVRWFGGGSYVAQVGGSKLTVDDLSDLARRRLAAATLIATIQGEGRVELIRKMGLTTDEIGLMFGLLQANRFSMGGLDQGLVMLIQFPDLLNQFEKNAPEDQRKKIADLRQKLVRLQENKDLMTALRMPSSALSARVMEENPNWNTPEGLVEFEYWKKKADDLGIVMSSGRVAEDLMLVGSNQFSTSDLADIVTRHRLSADVDSLLSWTADELRVMLARGTIQGPRGRASAPISTQVTPLDLWDAYVRVKTQLDVGVLPIPVDQKDFLAKVPEPSKEELEKYFDQYKNQEPDPTRDTPGFKIPTLYQVQFLYADLRPGTDTRKYYERWADAIDALDPVYRFAQVVNTYDLAKRRRFRINEALASVLAGGTRLTDGSHYHLPIPLPLKNLTASMAEQLVAARLAGSAAALASLGQAGPLGAAGVLEPLPQRAERDRPQPQAVGVAAAAAMGEGGLAATLGYLAQLDLNERYDAIEKVWKELDDEYRQEQLRQLAQEDLNKLSKDLREYSDLYAKEYAAWKARSARKPGLTFEAPLFTPAPAADELARPGDAKDKDKDKTEAKDKPAAAKGEPLSSYLQAFAKARGMVLEGMKEPRSRIDLLKEDAKTPLNTILKQLYVQQMPLIPDKERDEQIVDNLIGPRERGFRQPQKVFEPRMVREPQFQPKEYALFWKSAEIESRVPTFQEAEAKVLAAWKLSKAREFAKQEAERIAAQVKAELAKTKLEDIERKLRDQGYVDGQTLSRYKLQLPSGTAPIIEYTPAQPPVVEYPTDNLIETALKDLKSPGDTMVVSNRPQTQYYVFVLRNRVEPTAADPVSRGQFDLEVLRPSRDLQLRIQGQVLADWVVSERSRQDQLAFEKFLREQTQYNEEEAKKLAETLAARERDRF